MRKISKLTVLFLSLVLVMALMAGCGGDVAEPESDDQAAKDIKDIKIGVSVGTTTEERWQREIGMFEAYAEENGFELMVQSAENNAQKQVSQCENLINQGIDVMILQSLDAAAVAPIIDAAHQEGIPVIAYDRFAMNCDLDYYITFDSFKVGVTQATFVTGKAPTGH